MYDMKNVSTFHLFDHMQLPIGEVIFILSQATRKKYNVWLLMKNKSFVIYLTVNRVLIIHYENIF
jgi:hypothetical protein